MGDGDIQGIIGAVLAILFLVVFVSAMIPVFNSLNGCTDKQNEIDKLNKQNSDLNQLISSKDIEISGLKAVIDSTNKTLTEKESIISNLTGQLTEKDIVIANLTTQLSYYQEKKYLQEISNNYYNISNYFEKIENKFFPIEVSISLISITLFAIILKEFAVLSWLKRKFWKKESKKDENENKV